MAADEEFKGRWGTIDDEPIYYSLAGPLNFVWAASCPLCISTIMVTTETDRQSRYKQEWIDKHLLCTTLEIDITTGQPV